MSRILPLLLVGVAVTVGVFVWILQEPAREELDDIQVEATEKGDKSKARRANVPVKTSAKENFQPADVVKEQPLKFEATDTLDASNSSLVRVVYMESKKPVTSGRLSVLSLDEKTAMKLSDEFQRDMQGAFKKHGLHYRISETGEVRIPKTKGTQPFAAAFVDDFFGFGPVNSRGTSPTTIKVAKSKTVQVRLRNVAGEIVPNYLVLLNVSRDVYSSGDRMGATTAADGVAKIVLIPEMIRRSGTGWIHRIVPAGFWKDDVGLTIDPDNLPKEILELTLPESSFLEVRIENGAGRPLPGRFSLAVVPMPEGVDEDKAGSGGRMPVFVEEGVAKVEHISPGLRLHLRAQALGPSVLKPVKKIVVAPETPGETAVVRLQFTESDPGLTGRLLYSDNKPVANERLKFKFYEIRGGGRSSRSRTVETNKDGYFLVPVKSEASRKVDERKLIITFRNQDEQSHLLCEVNLPTTKEGVTNQDLGDLIMAQAPLIAAGTVRDEQGNLIADASIYFFSASDNYRVSRKFRAEIQGRPTSDAKGEFNAYGTCTTKELRVKVFAPGFLDEVKTVARGATGLSFVMKKGASIFGRIKTSGTVKPHEYQVKCLKEGDRGGTNTRADKDGKFKFESLVAGTYSLKVTLAGSNDPVTPPMQSLSLAKGQDLDVGSIEVGGGSQVVDFKLITPKRIDQNSIVCVEVRDPETQKVLNEAQEYGEVPKIVMPRANCDIRIVTQGYRECFLRGVSGGTQELRLQDGYSIVIEVENADILTSDFFYFVNAMPRKDRAGNMLSMQENGNKVSCFKTGTHIVSVAIGHKSVSGARFGVSVSPASIDVLDSTGVQKFKVKLKKTGVERVMKKLNDIASGKN